MTKQQDQPQRGETMAEYQLRMSDVPVMLTELRGGRIFAMHLRKEDTVGIVHEFRGSDKGTIDESVTLRRADAVAIAKAILEELGDEG